MGRPIARTSALSISYSGPRWTIRSRFRRSPRLRSTGCLHQRIDKLTRRLAGGLMLIGALVGLSILVAIMTHRYIVRPLQRLEGIARTVHETKNYGLHMQYQSHDEIGRLATAFDDMLDELAVAREREITQQLELARATRLTTMGEMTASIAHELNQPLAAIVANGHAGLRWLGRATPDLDEVKASLQRIVSVGDHASQIIGTIRATFKKGSEEKVPIDVNELVREVLTLLRRELHGHRIFVRTELAERLPRALGNRIQLQQVIVNLVTNAIEAMDSVTDHDRILHVASQARESDLLITVEDCGTGIDPSNFDRIFENFHDKIRWDGNGISDLPVNRRSPQRSSLGRARGAPGFGLLPSLANGAISRRVRGRSHRSSNKCVIGAAISRHFRGGRPDVPNECLR